MNTHSSKKLKNQQHSSKSTTINQFRPLIKSRVSKETVRDVVHMSANIQETLSNDDNRSVKSTLSTRKKLDTENNNTDKIKNFVRNMKLNKQSREQPVPVKIPKATESKDLAQSRLSIRSSRSNRSTKSNFISMHIEKDLLDNKSVISTRSIADETVSRSKICFGKESEEASKDKMMEKLNRMEEKMDFLVRTKLKNLMLRARTKHRYNPKPFLGARGFTEIDEPTENDNLLSKQIEAIIEAISSLKQKQTESPLGLSELEENISQLDKKIELLEKILASNFTQAEILKKFYFAQKSQKCPHLSRKERIIQEISKRKDMLKSNLSMVQMRDLRNKTPVLKYESTSKYYYSKPTQAAYLNPKSSMKPFIANRQPLPRSSYDREFLNYGTLPVFNYKPHDSKYTSSKLNVKTSNYQEAFKEKHMDLKQINYRELDCFKDKIKPGSISFSEMYKNKSLLCKKSVNNSSKEKQNNKGSIQKAIDTLNNLQKLSKLETGKLDTSNAKFMGCTEVKREFVWHTQEAQNNSEHHVTKGYGKTEVIKDAKLNNLKASYKMEFLR